MKNKILSVILTFYIFTAISPVTVGASNITIRKIASGLKFDGIMNFSEGLAAVQIGDWGTGKWGFINKTGEIVIPTVYDWVGGFNDGLAVVRIGDWGSGKSGCMDTSGNIIIPLIYDSVGWGSRSFSEGLARVSVDGKWGFIDREGNTVIPFIYDFAEDFVEGLAAVNIGGDTSGNGGKWGFIDTAGNVVVPIEYYGLYQMPTNDGSGRRVGFYNGIAAVNLGESWGFINKAGEIIYSNIRNAYAFAFFNEGLAAVENESNKWGFTDTAGNEVIPFLYNAAHSFNEGLAAVRIGDWETGKWGFIDKAGNVVVPVIYDMLQAVYIGSAGTNLSNIWNSGFRDGMVTLSRNGKWGVIDKTSKELVPFIYDYIGLFSDGVAPFNMGAEGFEGEWRLFPNGGKWGLVDQTGKEIVPAIYEFWGSFHNGLITVLERSADGHGTWGFMDRAGNFVVPVELEIEPFWHGGFHDGLFVARNRADRSYSIFEMVNASAAVASPQTGDNGVILIFFGFMNAVIIFVIVKKINKNLYFGG